MGSALLVIIALCSALAGHSVASGLFSFNAKMQRNANRIRKRLSSIRGEFPNTPEFDRAFRLHEEQIDSALCRVTGLDLGATMLPGFQTPEYAAYQSVMQRFFDYEPASGETNDLAAEEKTRLKRESRMRGEYIAG